MTVTIVLAALAGTGPVTLVEAASLGESDPPVWVPEMAVATGDIDPASVRLDLHGFSRTGLIVWRVNDGIWRVRVSERTGPRTGGAPFFLSAPGVQADSPYVVSDWESNLHVAVWRAFDGAHWRIQSSVKAEGGTWDDASNPFGSRSGRG